MNFSCDIAFPFSVELQILPLRLFETGRDDADIEAVSRPCVQVASIARRRGEENMRASCRGRS